METTITIPEPIIQAADQLAAELEISRNELYIAAINEFIKSHQQSEITRALNEVYQTESSELDPAIWQMQIASLPENDW